MTNGEWERYVIYGLPEYQFARDDKGEIMTDNEGNPKILACSEVLFKFDTNCECADILSHVI